MPIRRLGLLDAHVAETSLVMAWVEVPSLRVIRSEQGYSSATVGGSRVVRFRSLDGDFAAELAVDADGVVLTYPGIGRRVDPRAVRGVHWRPDGASAASGS